MSHHFRAIGSWSGGSLRPLSDQFADAIGSLDRNIFVVSDPNGGLSFAQEGVAQLGEPRSNLLACSPATLPAQLGSADFQRRQGLRAAYVTGAMANGIASVELVSAISGAGFLGFFGAAGLAPAQIEASILKLKQRAQDKPWGVNLIHSPHEMAIEAATAELLIKHGVRRVEASAFLDLTLPLIHYRVKGIYRDANGRVVAPNRVMGKVSREEVARKFLAPPPDGMLNELVSRGLISSDEAALAYDIPVASELTAESDSGGHTDNRPALALLPTILSLRDEAMRTYDYSDPIHVGLAGGISTPASAAAAFALGADYIVTGSVNQSCIESGSSDLVRQMLAETQQADVVMAPAADMFEMGVKVQVLKRGTMFAMRGQKLFQLYREYDSLDALPEKEQSWLEKTILRQTLSDAWSATRAYFAERDPAQIERAEREPKHKMALLFRSYLGQSSNWANAGKADRKIDFQVWCGPAMGAFNQWARGSHLEAPENRRVVDVALNILYGAAFLTRVTHLRQSGIPLPDGIGTIAPRDVSEIQRYFE